MQQGGRLEDLPPILHILMGDPFPSFFANFFPKNLNSFEKHIHVYIYLIAKMSTPIIGEGSSRDKASLRLFTKKGSHIRNVQRREQLPERLQAVKTEMERIFPEALLRTVTGTYNCMGMVFASRRTWVETDSDVLNLILEDDGYRKVEDVKTLFVGDIVVYRSEDGEPQHVGIVIEKTPQISSGNFEIKVLSKWGNDGECIHELNYIPSQCGIPTDFYTDRKEGI